MHFALCKDLMEIVRKHGEASNHAAACAFLPFTQIFTLGRWKDDGGEGGGILREFGKNLSNVEHAKKIKTKKGILKKKSMFNFG